MRKSLCSISVGVALAVSLLVMPAGATGAGRAASACPNATVNGGKDVGNLTLRFVLLGSVSCDEAHRLIRAFFSHAATGPCEGTLCLTAFPGSWTCGYFFAAESKETGGAIAGCYQTTTGVRVRVYKASHVTASHSAVVFSPLAYGISCHMTDDGSVGGSWVYCWIGANPHPTRHVKLNGRGQFNVAATTAIPLGLGGPALAYSRQVTIGRFRCQSLRSGMKCTVIATGHGFLFNRNGAIPVK
jgi:hypothetical protein